MEHTKERMAGWVKALQAQLCERLEAADGAGHFGNDPWIRPGGGGGITRVLEDGAVFEKAGVNSAVVHGELEPALARALPGQSRRFFAAGVSVVLHPRSPRVPTAHLNCRFLVQGEQAWFGGGADLTPFYLEEEDVTHFHQTFAAVCEAHEQGAYARYKEACDAYFFLPHRGEARGTGGIFFDGLAPADEVGADRLFAFVRAVGEAFLPAWLPILERRRAAPWGERERAWQLARRSRYVEFNLVHDRGTRFGLETAGRIESVLMSLPPLVAWPYDAAPPGPEEARLLEVLRTPRSWAGVSR